jgi:REP element-mobilizing transposase RayT
MADPGSRRLRFGRYSELSRIYRCTTATAGRVRLFDDFNLGRIVVRRLKTSDDYGRTSTLAFVVMPDHFHWLFQLTGGAGLSAVM